MFKWKIMNGRIPDLNLTKIMWLWKNFQLEMFLFALLLLSNNVFENLITL